MTNYILAIRWRYCPDCAGDHTWSPDDSSPACAPFIYELVLDHLRRDIFPSQQCTSTKCQVIWPSGSR